MTIFQPKVINAHEEDSNPWVELASAGREKWNAFIRSYMGELWWENIIDLLPNDYPKNLLNVKPLEDSEYFFWYQKIEAYYGEQFFKKLDEGHLISISFGSCTFDEDINFNGYVFTNVKFTSALFEKSSEFDHAVFTGTVSFLKANFGGSVSFAQAIFFERAIFERVSFKDINFDQAIFKSFVSFNRTQFDGFSVFTNVNFFQADFIGCEFDELVNFKDSTFKSPPCFEGVKCEAIYFDRSEKMFQNDLTKENLHRSVSAWESLVRLMEQVHDLRQRHIFHEKLLEVEQHYRSELFARPLYSIYRLLGNGRHAFLPFWWMVALSSWFCAFYMYNGLSWKKALSYTIANDLPFLGQSRVFLREFSSNNANYDLLLFSVGGLQSVLSLFFLFMMGLALRNRFRIK